MRFTSEHLRIVHACPQQRQLFERTFPNGAPLTLAAMKKAYAVGLDVRWTDGLLSGATWVEYQKASDLAWAECEKVRDLAEAEYEKVRGRALLKALRKTLQEGTL